ncbi:uncharacterized protein QC763_0080570 [Podospora pseudopauciseta]|uniref:Uncharacterized protein n=1 Tax=Podospora pseudopauciseta TaxID=2093780 RepID=A0ABR0H7B2_9PEZI|nr:hypothetical protein QC763_0080570 [Podospora pseudopauciseta]
MTALCHPVVFACGFLNCKVVFKAPDTTGPAKTADEYFNHVANHVQANHNWSYSTYFRNLMRQPGVDDAWKNRSNKGVKLRWQRHTSSVLREILETRHIPDVGLFVDWAVKLGSKPFCTPTSPVPTGLPDALYLPVLKHCEYGANSAPEPPYQPNASPGSPQVPDSLPNRSADFDFSAYPAPSASI